MPTIPASEADKLHCNRKRWRQLILGILCMAMIANLQYGWTLFVAPLHQAQGWALAAIQVAFKSDPTGYTLANLAAKPLDGRSAESEHIRSFQLMARRLARICGVAALSRPRHSYKAISSIEAVATNDIAKDRFSTRVGIYLRQLLPR